VLTSGSTGDGDLPVRLQEHAVLVPYPLGLVESYSNTKSKLKTEMLAHELIYIQDPTLTDFYNLLR
jgi:hypothetical protein